MKKIFTLFLCCSVLLYGCYPLSSLTHEELFDQTFQEKDIIVTLVDDCVIKSSAYHHISTTEPSNFIYGTGKQTHRFIRSEHKEFIGKIHPSSFDSLGFIGRYLVGYLPDSTYIYFDEGNYVVITPDRTPGLWCAGILAVDGKDSIFSGYLPADRIKQIEMKKFSEWQTYFLVAGLTIIVVILVAIISISSSLSKIGNLNLKF